MDGFWLVDRKSFERVQFSIRTVQVGNDLGGDVPSGRERRCYDCKSGIR